MPAIRVPKIEAPENEKSQDEAAEVNNESSVELNITPPENPNKPDDEQSLIVNDEKKSQEDNVNIEQNENVDYVNNQYDGSYFESLIKELSDYYIKEDKRYLSAIVSNCRVELSEGKLLFSIPKGLNNEALNEEKIQLKQFFSKNLLNIDFELEFIEMDAQFESAVPYTNEDKIKTILNENPDFQEWINKLNLRY